jgi:hypothetical protein
VVRGAYQSASRSRASGHREACAPSRALDPRVPTGAPHGRFLAPTASTECPARRATRCARGWIRPRPTESRSDHEASYNMATRSGPKRNRADVSAREQLQFRSARCAFESGCQGERLERRLVQTLEGFERASPSFDVAPAEESRRQMHAVTAVIRPIQGLLTSGRSKRSTWFATSESATALPGWSCGLSAHTRFA